MTTGAEIVEQLNKAHESDSPTDKEQETTEKEEKTEVTQTQTEEGSSTEKGSKETDKDTKSSQTIPYDRFKEKVDQVHELTERLEKVIGESETSTARENELRKQVQSLEEEANVLDRIRQLAENEKYRGLVETLDKALKGEEEAVESGAKTKEEAAKDVTKLFEKHQKKLDEAFADQRADILLEQARMVSDGILDSLPAEYDEGDKSIVAGLVPKHVDWAKVEADPSIMKQSMVDGYKAALKEYGEPRGALKTKLEEFENNKPEKPVEEIPSDEEVIKGILDDERLSKMRTDDKGKVLGPEMSDSEVEQKMAEIMRRTA